MIEADENYQRVVCILAHNEEKRIELCLSSLPLQDRRYQFYVVVNGTTDRTVELAQQVLKDHDNARVIDLKPGGKSRSWNTFVYDIAPQDAEVYFFVDGDAEIKAGSLEAMETKLTGKPHINAVGAPPLTGRLASYYRDRMVEIHGMFGDLYALSGDFLRRVRAHNHRLPDELIGDDGMVRSWASTDLGTDHDWDKNRIAVCLDAGFSSEVMSLVNPRHLKIQFKRMINYSERHFQNVQVSRIMKTDGVAGVPADISTLTAERMRLRDIRFKPSTLLFDFLAQRRIREKAARLESGVGQR